MDVPKITEADAGCWLDGSQGWHNNYRVIQRALNHGWQHEDITSADLDAVVDLYSEGQDGDTRTLSTGEVLSYEDACGIVIDQGGLSDAATAYLASKAPEGYTFVWDAGELSLMSDADADEFGMLG